MSNTELMAALHTLGLLDSFKGFIHQLRYSSVGESNRRLADWKKNVLKPAFKAKALVCHPDRGGSTEEMIELTKAYELADSCAMTKTAKPVMLRATYIRIWMQD